MGGWWRWALVSPDGVAPSQMVSVSATVNLPLHHKVQKFSSGTDSPGCSWKKGHKMVVWCGLLWPNGWMNEDATWYRSRPRPRPHCVRWRPSSYPQKGHSSPRLFLAHVYCGHGHSSQLLLSSCLCVATACFVSIFVRFYYEFCIL